jgi:hypothetical protein
LIYLTTKSEFAFNGMKYLNDLNLVFNKLFSINRNVLALENSGLKTLEYLSLDENKISELSVNLAENFATLKSMKLGFNQIKFITPDFFKNAIYLQLNF